LVKDGRGRPPVCIVALRNLQSIVCDPRSAIPRQARRDRRRGPPAPARKGEQEVPRRTRHAGRTAQALRPLAFPPSPAAAVAHGSSFAWEVSCCARRAWEHGHATLSRSAGEETAAARKVGRALGPGPGRRSGRPRLPTGRKARAAVKPAARCGVNLSETSRPVRAEDTATQDRDFPRLFPGPAPGAPALCELFPFPSAGTCIILYIETSEKTL